MTYEYNTARKRLILPEYGRNIQKMVEYAMNNIEDRDERTRYAHKIVSIMGNIHPNYNNSNDFKRKLWDHLAIISDFKLDIDFPYETPKLEIFYESPEAVPYNQHRLHHKHYGYNVEQLIKEVSEYDEGEKKDTLVRFIANHMKRLYIMWNKDDAVSDDIIINDMKEISGGKLPTNQDLKLVDAREMTKSKKKRSSRKNKS